MKILAKNQTFIVTIVKDGIRNCKAVLDPFIGIGSTALASVQTGVPCVGFDVDMTYLEICKDRIRLFNLK